MTEHNQAAQPGAVDLDAARAAFDDRHCGYEFPSSALRSGARDEFIAGWKAALIAQVREARPAGAALDDLWIHEDMDRDAAASALNAPRKDLKAAHTQAVDSVMYWRRRALTAEAAAQPQATAQPGDDKHLPGWERGIATVTLSGHQLRAALDFINPDGESDFDQLDDELTFGIVQHKDDGEKVAVGMCCWNDDTDGVLPLDGDYTAVAAHPTQQLADEGERVLTPAEATARKACGLALSDVDRAAEETRSAVSGITGPGFLMRLADLDIAAILRATLAQRVSSAPAITEITDAAARKLIDFIYERVGFTDRDALIGDVQRIVIGCMNASYSAGVRDAAPTPASAPATQPADERLRALLESEFDCYRTSAGLIEWAINALLDNSPHRVQVATQRADSALPAGAIKTWQERSGMREFILPKDAAPHMVAEIKELRAALQQAATSQPAPAEDARDAARYRTLRDLMQSAKGSASIEVNQHLAYYETAEPGEEVKLQWYPDTPIGFYTIEGSTLDEVADAAMHSTHQAQDSVKKGGEA